MSRPENKGIRVDICVSPLATKGAFRNKGPKKEHPIRILKHRDYVVITCFRHW